MLNETPGDFFFLIEGGKEYMNYFLFHFTVRVILCWWCFVNTSRPMTIFLSPSPIRA